MKLLIMRLGVAILAFSFGLAIDRILFSPIPAEIPPVHNSEVCGPSPVELPRIFHPPPPPSPHAIYDFDSKEFDPAGDYYLVGKTPEGFDQLNGLYLTWTYDNMAAAATIHATVHETYDKYTADFSWVTRRRVLLVTKPKSVDAFAYRFDGEFLHYDLGSFANTTKPVLRGTLTRLKGEKKIAEAIVSFRLEQHAGC